MTVDTRPNTKQMSVPEREAMSKPVARDPRKKDATAKVVVKILKQCIESNVRVNALGPKATYSQVMHARGLHEIAAHQLAMFAPQILKLLKARKRRAE